MSAHQESQNPKLIHVMDELEAGEVAVELDDKAPQEVMAWAIDHFGDELGLCSSFQAEGCVLIDMAHKIDLQMDFGTAIELRAIQMAGLAFLFVPIQTVSYGGVPPQKFNQVSGIMNLSRNMGGDIGIAFVTTLITRRSQVHQVYLSAHTTPYDPAYVSKVDVMTRAFEHAGAASIDAARQATAAVYRQLVVQATQLAYLDALLALGVATAVMVPLVWLASRPAPQGAPMGH